MEQTDIRRIIGRTQVYVQMDSIVDPLSNPTIRGLNRLQSYPKQINLIALLQNPVIGSQWIENEMNVWYISLLKIINCITMNMSHDTTNCSFKLNWT